MMRDNTRLAALVVSFGKLNDFSSTVLATKKALDTKNIGQLKYKKDQDLMNDALAGIKVAKEVTFGTDGIIAINKALHHSAEEDPDMPGHLRNALYNPDDAVTIITDPRGSSKGAYFPPDVVTKEDLEQIVDQFNSSQRTTFDGLRLFAELSKLQPFQDGNKRTALLAVNTALDTWEDENYFILPFDELDFAQFSLGLMRYYRAKGNEQEEQALKLMQMFLPNKSDLLSFNHETVSPIDVDKLKTKRIQKRY